MNYDPLALLEESPEDTAARLLPLARQELDEAVAAGEAVATALDGSLSSGRFWPSSDLDVTMVSADPEARGLRGGIRNGIGVHQHIQGWAVLDRIRDGWPASSLGTWTNEWWWLRDAIWLLDGLATITPVHDPGGRLAALREFVRERRFAPEVIAPHRPVLVRGATAAAEDGYLTTAGEILALIWLEAAGRIISGKESDPELRDVCALAGAPEAHGFFRRVAGVDGIEGREPEFARACRSFLEVFSPWVDALLAAVPFRCGEIDGPIPSVLYLRQTAWSGLYAPGRGCLLHLAGVKRALEEAGPAMLAELATGPGGELISRLPAIEAAGREILAFFPAGPAPQREAFDRLVELTRRTFSIGN